MNKLINELFELLYAENKECFKTADKNIEQEIRKLLEPLKSSLTDEKYEELKGIIFIVAHISGKEMFSVGFYFALDLLCKRL